MIKKIIIFIIPFLVITIIFLLFVLFMGRQGGSGALQVTSKPISQIFLDGNYIGNTPLSLMELPDLLTVGEYELKLVPTEKGYSEWKQKINIYKNALTVVDKTFDKSLGSSSSSIITLIDINDKNKSELLVISFPSGAQVILDSAIKGETPILIDDITTSDHEIKIIKDGYKEKVVKIKAVPSKRLEVVTNLGIRTDLTEQNLEATKSAELIKKIKILDTPTGFLRVRESANLNSPQIGIVNPGDELDLIAEEGEWFQISLPEDLTGWVSAEYAEKVGN
jgi:hypothetical protein